MFELTINNRVYQFNFGIGFVKEVNPCIKKPVDGVPGLEEDVGVAYRIGQIIDGDVLALVSVLELANKGFEPRVTRKELENYIDNPQTDIETLFKDVLDFFKNANATKRVTNQILTAMNR